MTVNTKKPLKKNLQGLSFSLITYNSKLITCFWRVPTGRAFRFNLFAQGSKKDFHYNPSRSIRSPIPLFWRGGR